MSLGLALGRGETLEEALAGKLSVAEGVASAPAVTALAARSGVETPICDAVRRHPGRRERASNRPSPPCSPAP